MNSRYSWKKMTSDYSASYFNDKDYKEGKKFVVIDNISGMEYTYSEDNLDLLNEEFIEWAICTSIDFVNHVSSSWYTQSVLNYIVDNYEFVEIFSDKNKLVENMNGNLWIRVFQRNNDVVRYVPKVYMTTDMINALGNMKNVDLKNVDYSSLTPELFAKIYFNCDTEHKIRLITGASQRIYRSLDFRTCFLPIIQNLITPEVKEDVLTLEIKDIWHLPIELISEKNAIDAMERDIRLIRYVPAKYQTLEYQKRAVDKSIGLLSAIDSTVLLDEVIYYALSKKSTALNYISPKRLTINICEYSVNLYPSSLKYVPNKKKTKQMCLNAVIKEPTLIKYVPVEILNFEFIKELQNANVIIPIEFQDYVNECLKVHNMFENVTNNIEYTESNININENLFNIRLNSLTGLISETSLKFLLDNNIISVGDLLLKSQNGELISIFTNINNSKYREVCAVVRLLKCKYLDIDPMVDFNLEKPISDTMKDFGFTARTSNCIMRNGYTTKTFFELLMEEDFDKKLLSIKNSGPFVVQEILFKTSIIFNYYNNHNKKEDSMLKDEQLTGDNSEIEKLSEINNKILLKIKRKKNDKQE